MQHQDTTKILAVCGPVTNEYLKEKEKNTITLAIYQGVSLVTIGNYL